MESDIASLQARLREFRDARDWEQFHETKNLAVALSVEASELCELMLWMTNDEVDRSLSDASFREAFIDECADVFNYLTLISDRVGFDLVEAASAKISKNSEKYPVDKSKGNSTKYNRL